MAQSDTPQQAKYGYGRVRRQQPRDSQPASDPKDISLARKLIAGGIRVGSSILSGPPSLVPGKGSALAFGIGAGGDLLAQAVEEKAYPWEQLDPKSLTRASVEGGISAVPLGKWIQGGKALVSALRSGALTGTGEAAREVAASEGKAVGEKLSDIDPASVAVATGLGAATGGLISKFLSRKPKSPKPPITATGPTSPIDFVKKSTGEQLESAAKQAEALVVADPQSPFASTEAAKGLRVAAVKSGKATEGTKDKLISERKAELAQEARNLDRAGSAEITQHKAADDLLTNAQKAERAEQKWIEDYKRELERLQKAQNSGAAANIEVMEAQAKKIADEAAATKVDELKGGLEEQPAVVKESFTKQTPEGGKETATITHRAPREEGGGGAAVPAGPREPRTTNPGPLEKSGARVMTADRARAVTGMDPEEAAVRGLLFKDGDGYRLNPKYKPTAAPVVETAPPPASAAPEAALPAPKPGVFQVVSKDGRVVDATDEATAEALVGAAGPGSRVVLPSDYTPPAPKKPKAPKKETIKGTAAQVAAKLPEEAPKAPTAAPEAPAPAAPQAKPAAPAAPVLQQTPVAAPGPLSAQSRLAELGYTPDDITKMSAKEANEIIRSGTQKAAPVPAAPIAAEIPGPLAEKITQAQQDVPAGSVIARFFPNRDSALKAGAYAEELPDNVIGMLNPIMGRAEASSALGKAEAKAAGTKVRDNPRTEAAVGLWDLVKKAGKALDLPQFPRGSHVRPNFKHVPEDIRPTPTSDASVVDVPVPAAPVAGMPDLSGGIPPAQPVPPALQVRIKAAIDKAQILQNAGKTEADPEVQKVIAEINDLQQQIILAEHPWIAQIAKAEQEAAEAAKNLPKPPKQDLKPRLNKKPRNPEKGAVGTEMLLSGTGALAGGLTGAVTDPLDDPFASAVFGALGGAAAGFGGARALEAFASTGITPATVPEISVPERLWEAGKTFGHLIPHIQRFNYLMSVPGLGANAVAGPYGAGFWGSLTKGLAGDPRGWAALKILANPARVAKEMWQGRNEAMDLITRAEAGDPTLRHELGGEAIQNLPSMARDAIQAPARIMTSGDIGIRNILKQAGFSEDEAREMTLTAEPFIPSLVKLANLRRGEASPMLDIMLPFVRTPANIIEQGLMRMPGVGFAAHRVRQAQGAIPADTSEQIIQQVIGTIMGVGGYVAGLNMDPETARLLRRYVTNSAGQYGLPTALGFAAGQASARGRSPASRTALAEFGRAFPLPTADPIMDVGQFVLDPSSGPPRNLVPALFRETGAVSDGQPTRPKYRYTAPTQSR